MKPKPFGIIIALAVTALAVYIYHLLGGSVVLIVAGGIATCLSAVLCMGVSLIQPRTSVLSSVASLVFLLVFIALNALGALFGISIPLIIILNAIALIIYALVMRGLWSAAQ